MQVEPQSHLPRKGSLSQYRVNAASKHAGTPASPYPQNPQLNPAKLGSRRSSSTIFESLMLSSQPNGWARSRHVEAHPREPSYSSYSSYYYYYYYYYHYYYY